MKKTILFAIINLIGLFTYTQNKAANWYFGYKSGIQFNLGAGTVTPLTDSEVDTHEGCASISDDFGNLLFYTDGITIWNRNHDVMENGLRLFGDPSSTQSGLIVPKPNNDNAYYVFTVDNHGIGEAHFGLNYTEVDMTLDGGLGGVVTKNTNLLQDCTEKITAVLKDCVTESIWVLAFASENGTDRFYNTFHAFEVSSTGVNSTSVKSTFPLAVTDVRGYLKLSPDGTKMACANGRDGLFIYDFDAATGLASNQEGIGISGASNVAYGLEFSPDSQLLYVHASNDFFANSPQGNEVLSNHSSTLLQYNLQAANIPGSVFTVDDRQLYRGGLQLGPNGKIYRALSGTYNQGIPFLGAIDNPNIIGAGCNYIHDAVSLSPNDSSQGLPPFIASFFNTDIDIIKDGNSSINLVICEGLSYTLVADNIPGATYSWLVDGTPISSSNNELEVFNSGHYELTINPNNGDCPLKGQAFVNFPSNPEAYNHTLLQCDEDGNSDGRTLFNLNQAHAEITGGVPDRITKFYTDFARTIEVNGDAFSNTSNPQTIYVEVIDDTFGCYNFSELTLEVSNTSVQNVELKTCADPNNQNGFRSFNLNNADTLLLNGAPSGLIVSYYETYNDALLETNSITGEYMNTTPHSQTIFARVENSNNCYGISNVLLTVQPIPEIEKEATTYYCLNNFPNTISIDAGIINDSPSNYTYLWSNGDTSYETQINAVGTYTVQVTDDSGCPNTRTVTVEPSNIATFASPAFTIEDELRNNNLTVFVSGEGTYQYSLVDQNNNIIRPYQDSNLFENINPGIHKALVKDVKNDCGVVTENVSVIGFPKFFTPNNDGFNDTWQILGVSAQFQPTSKIYIFDRFGKLLKQITPASNGWDGTFNGQLVPVDDYWFSVKLEDGRIIKNHFSLKY